MDTEKNPGIKKNDSSFHRLKSSVLGLLYVTVLDESYDDKPDEREKIIEVILSSMIALCDAIESWGSSFTKNNLLNGIEELKLNKQVSDQLMKEIEKLTKKS